MALIASVRRKGVKLPRVIHVLVPFCNEISQFLGIGNRGNYRGHFEYQPPCEVPMHLRPVQSAWVCSIDRVRQNVEVRVERERLRSTGVGSGVAIPHGKVPGLEHLLLAVGLSREGVDFGAADGLPVHIFMALAAPMNSTGNHLRALARIARLCSDADFRRRLLDCASDEEAYQTIVSADERQAP